MRTLDSDPLDPAQAAELARLAELPESDIDTADIPEQRDWSNAQRGAFYRPIKRQITLRLDSDLIAWFRRNAKDAKGYQTSINRALREYVEAREK